jgi:hypothetical protein
MDKTFMVVDKMKQRNGLMPLIASIGIGAACYQMMKHNRAGQAIKGRMDKMMHQKQVFPENG